MTQPARSSPGNPAVSGTIYRAQGAYRIYALVAAGLVVVLAWLLSSSFDWVTLLGLLTAAGIGIWAIGRMLTTIEIHRTDIVVHSPLRQPLRIEGRQITGIHEEGRLVKAPVVLYYRLGADGLIDVEGMRGLALPAVQDQAAFLAALNELAPHLGQ